MFNSVQQHVQQITQQNQLPLFNTPQAAPQSNPVAEAKKRKLENTLLILRALGVEYVIKDESGRVFVHGGLELKEPKPAKLVRKKRIVTAPHGTYTSILEASGFDAMQVGDLLVIDPQGYNPESLRSTASSRASRAWGLSSLTTEVNNGKLEALRVK
jgi:hypothetical protein